METREKVLASIFKTIKDNVPDMFGSELSEDTVLNEKTNIDSMGFILVLTKLEGEFGVKIPDEKWNDIRTIRDLADMILAYMPKN